jgi:hypothetical protein
MKTKKQTNLAILFALISLLVITCKSEKTKEPNPSTQPFSATFRVQSLDFLNTVSNPKWMSNLDSYGGIYRKYSMKDSFYSSFVEINGNEMAEFIRSLTTYDVDARFVVIYLNENPSKVEGFSTENINAISFYTPEGNGNLYHQLYVKSGKGYAMRPDYLFVSNLAASNHMTFLLHKVLPKSLKSNSYICINNKDAAFIPKNSNDGFFMKEALFYSKWAKQYRKGDNQTFAPPTGGDGGTGAEGCGEQDGCKFGLSFKTCTLYPNSNVYQCWSSGDPSCCAVKSFTLCSESGNYNQQNLINAFDVTLHHQFRDQILENSYVGQKYGYYFYAATNTISENATLSFAGHVFNVLPQMNSVINKMLNPTGSENQVLVDSTFAAGLQIIIDDMREMSEDEGFQEMLDDLENDLEYFTGMVLSDVLEVLED